MNTEITEYRKVSGWILYDADCPYCMALARRFQPLLAGRHFELLPLQTPGVAERLHLSKSELLKEMRVLRPNGKCLGGANALLEIARDFWWARPLRLLGRIGPVRHVLHIGYRWIARNRSCAAGTCEIGRQNAKKRIRAVDFLPLLVLPLTALLLRSNVPPWVFMWAMAFALYFGCKWLTYRQAVCRGLRPKPARIVAYLLAWAGMDAADFLDARKVPANGISPGQGGYDAADQIRAIARLRSQRQIHGRPYPGLRSQSRLPGATHIAPLWGFSLRLRRQLRLFADDWLRRAIASFHDPNACETIERGPQIREWLFAVAKMSGGVIAVWVLARLLLPGYPILAGWVGMIGIVFILHFGLFHLLALFWRQGGIKTTPVMQNPLLATSLAEFWGRRWNTAFNELAFRFAYWPLRRITTPLTATLLVFGLSGLIHDLLISLAAGGGYGFPTLYFLIQGLGTIIERSRFGHRIGLGRGARGWLFTLLVTVAPVPWLFHPTFIRNVILPMLNAIGAT